VILQVLAHAGQACTSGISNWRSSSGLPTPERCRICGEAIAPAHSSTLCWPSLLTGGAVALQPLDAHRALAGKNNAIGQRVGADGQVGRARLVEIAARGAGAAALRRHGAVHRAKAFLLVAVEIVGARVAGLHAGFNHRLEQRIIARLWRGDAHRAVAAVVVVGADIAGFRFAVVGQAVEVAPVLQPRRLAQLSRSIALPRM
jgi:hypothetical protein